MGGQKRRRSKHPLRNNNDGEEAVSNPDSIRPAVGRAGHNVPYANEKDGIFHRPSRTEDRQSRTSLSHNL